MILALQRSMVRYFVVQLLGLSASWSVLAQEQHAEYFKKYGGMPPLDMRVTLNGKEVRGLFEAALASKVLPPKELSLEDVLIPVVVGQKLIYKVEISQRGANQWSEISKHPNLLISEPTKRIQISKSTTELWVLGNAANPQQDMGIYTMIFYYSDRNPKDEQAAYTHLYFGVKRKP